MAIADSLRVTGIQSGTDASSAVSGGSTIDLAVLTLDDQGWICDCSWACEQMFGYSTDELLGRHISMLLPQLPDTDLVQDERINSRLAFLCRCAIAFDARRRDGQYFSSELFINRIDRHNVVVLVRSLQA